MSYELLKRWLDDSNSVTTLELDQAEQALMEQIPTGPNICLLACLSAINDSDLGDATGLVQNRIAKYEQEINW